ncbi:hypothetical protein PCE1_002480 [Barthelona sp. PCE]
MESTVFFSQLPFRVTDDVFMGDILKDFKQTVVDVHIFSSVFPKTWAVVLFSSAEVAQEVIDHFADRVEYTFINDRGDEITCNILAVQATRTIEEVRDSKPQRKPYQARPNKSRRPRKRATKTGFGIRVVVDPNIVGNDIVSYLDQSGVNYTDTTRELSYLFTLEDRESVETLKQIEIEGYKVIDVSDE